jgi:hypothetical protein
LIQEGVIDYQPGRASGAVPAELAEAMPEENQERDQSVKPLLYSVGCGYPLRDIWKRLGSEQKDLT